MQNVTHDMINGFVKGSTNNINIESFLNNIPHQIILNFLQLEDIISNNKIYLTLILIGALLILLGMYISIYQKVISKNRKLLTLINGIKYLKYIEIVTNRFPLKVLSYKLSEAVSYFMLEEIVQKSTVAIFTLILPTAGILLYLILSFGLNLWYTKIITLFLCIMLPYYIFTLVVDYMKYRLRLKIPLLIDSFRGSFMMQYRIKPALQECGLKSDKSLGRIMRRVSDSSDLNESLYIIRDRVNDTWFNIFVLLILNYRENGGELIAQLYKLSRSITRYNNIEKKKNKRMIWYEVFAVLVSVFSLPAIILINKMILGIDSGAYYDATAAFTKIVIFSITALIIIRVLRRM